MDGLGKIALTVEQADSDQRHAHVAGRLAVIPGENAETSGINGKAFVESELGAKIRNQVVTLKRLRALAAHAGLKIAVVSGKRALEAGGENRIIGRVNQSTFIDSPEKRSGVTADGVPQRFVQALE